MSSQAVRISKSRNIGNVSENLGSIMAQPFSDTIASKFTEDQPITNIINSFAGGDRNTASIYSEMLKGSVSDGLSNVFGALTKFTVGKVGGV
jgi:hypothetical protein